jgi:L-alanine-DL-glutamate epimerase-like enolase superfamily enzyme
MHRRTFLNALLAGAGAMTVGRRAALAALPKMKITRVRYYAPGRQPRKGVQSLLSSSNVICVDTDAGITGLGEGGTRDTLEHCASALIGQDPSRIELHWQNMFRGNFYPTGKEKLHALGGLDIALWDIKAKALGVPVYELLGGRTRDSCDTYTIFPVKTTWKEAARECMEAGFSCFRTEVIGAGLPEGRTSGRGTTNWNPRTAVMATLKICQEAREGVGPDGDWLLDCHGKLDWMDSVTLANLVEPLRPFFVEDMVRPGAEALYRDIRPLTKVPIATADGGKFEIHELVEQRLVNYVRVMIPNCGGITEYMKIASMCETHLAALSPHTTGPIATAAEVHVAAATTVPFLLQNSGPRTAPYLPQCVDFRKGRTYVNDRPGLGVEFDPKEATLICEVTEPGNLGGMYRTDGSYTNW